MVQRGPIKSMVAILWICITQRPVQICIIVTYTSLESTISANEPTAQDNGYA